MGDLEHSRVQGLMMAQNQPQHMVAEEMARRDKLERNRLSAQKCRAKRKAAARGSQERMANLTFDNAALTQENQRLRMLLAQAGIQDDTSVFDDTPRKRVKYETGITHSFDSSESAVFATTQQRFYLLAMMITILYSTLVATKKTLSSSSNEQVHKEAQVAAPAAVATIHCTPLQPHSTTSCSPTSQTSCRKMTNTHYFEMHTHTHLDNHYRTPHSYRTAACA